MNDTSFLSIISHADILVKSVMAILLICSVVSWTLIFQRAQLIKSTQKEAKHFEKQFWSGVALTELFHQTPKDVSGLPSLFRAGFEEWNRLKNIPTPFRAAALENIQRAMKVAEAQSLEQMESQVSILATIGSVSPYVGLFGTVWGIMSSFHGLGSVQQATLAMVAPGISEALIATAMGLFAAIPAVVAYNRFSQRLNTIAGQYERFQDTFINLVNRQWIAAPSTAATTSSF